VDPDIFPMAEAFDDSVDEIRAVFGQRIGDDTAIRILSSARKRSKLLRPALCHKHDWAHPGFGR
jgi:hypothetical protein